MTKSIQKKLSIIMIAMSAVAVFFYIFFLNTHYAQALCIGSIYFAGLLIHGWTLKNEKVYKLLECMGILVPTAILPFLSKLPLADWLCGWMNRVITVFTDQLGVEITALNNAACLQVAYWVLFWLGWLIVWIVKCLRKKDEVPALATQNYTGQLVQFCHSLSEQIKAINRDSAWDADTFTPIDTEVEAEIHGRRKRKFADLHRCIDTYRRKNVVFLALGDPGSGKSVAMRKLAMDLLKESKETGVVPVYLDLKRWNQPWSVTNKPTEKDLLEFVMESLNETRNPMTKEFLDNHFQLMLDNGRWFFIFDSFDELPCLLGRDSCQDLIRELTALFHGFLSAPGRCGGIIASRPFRGPEQNLEKTVTLRLQSFSDMKINAMLKKYGVHTEEMAKQLFHQRSDLLSLCRNPFYLSLLIDFLREHGTTQFPEDQLQLYNSFLDVRLKANEEKIRAAGFRPEQLRSAASALALHLQKKPEKGLECPVSELMPLHNGWDWEKLVTLLAQIRLCRFGGQAKTVSFVHRRFQEFFVVQDILDQDKEISKADYKNVTHNRSMRDVLILYCEVAPVDKAREIAAYCWNQVLSGIDARRNINEAGCLALVNTLHFMADAFRSRPDAILPFRSAFQQLLTTYLDQDTDYYVQHAMASCMPLFDQDAMQHFALQVLNLNNVYLSDLMLFNCRAITEKPAPLLNAEFVGHFASQNRKRFFQQFRNLDFSLSRLPQFGYIRNMHRLCMAAELSMLLVCVLVAAYAPFIYLWDMILADYHVPLPEKLLLLTGFAFIAIHTYNRFVISFSFNRRVGPDDCLCMFLVVSGLGALSYSAFAREFRVLFLIGIPVMFFWSIHILHSLYHGFREKYINLNILTVALFSLILIGTVLVRLGIEAFAAYRDFMGKASIYSFSFFAFAMGYFLLREPLFYLRDSRWLKKQPMTVRVIERREIEKNLRKLKSQKVRYQYLQMLWEKDVKLKGSWTNKTRPIYDNGQIDLLLTRLDADSRGDQAIKI